MDLNGLSRYCFIILNTSKIQNYDGTLAACDTFYHNGMRHDKRREFETWFHDKIRREFFFKKWQIIASLRSNF